MRYIALTIIFSFLALCLSTGGGDHDKIAYQVINLRVYLETKSIDQLKDYCKKVQRWVIENHLENAIIGDIEDYLNKLNDEQLVRFILEKCVQFKNEILKLEDFKRIFDSRLATLQEGHDELFPYYSQRKSLIKWALALEWYERSKMKIYIDGGLHDHIDQADDEEIAKYIIQQIKKYPEFGTPEKLDELEKRCMAMKEGIDTEDGLESLLRKEDIFKLKIWAVVCERYHNTHKKSRERGIIHEFIHQMTKDELINYILAEVKDHKELNSATNLDSLAYEYELLSREMPNPTNGDFHEVLKAKTRDKLISWALVCERFHNKELNQTIEGGMHDYVNNLSDSEIIEYILYETNEHSELNSEERLNELEREYGLGRQVPHVEPNFGFLFAQPQFKLISYALTLEVYHNLQYNITRFGKLRSVVNTLSKEELIEFINQEFYDHPELATESEIDKLAIEYKYLYPLLSEEQLAVLKEQLWKEPIEILRIWAIACEEYDERVNNYSDKLGIRNIIKTHPKDLLIEFILTSVKTHPNLGSVEQLSTLAEGYMNTDA